MKKNLHLKACVLLSAGLLCFSPAGLHAQSPTGKVEVSYAQLLADKVAFDHADVAGIALYLRNGAGSLELAGHAGVVADTISRNSLPLLDDTGADVGVMSIVFASAPADRVTEATIIRDELRQVTPKRETLSDPYTKGYAADDTLAQRINQILLARHPDVNVIAIHLTKPGDAKNSGDAKNKVWGMNRPNFIRRDSDEVDTDTEKTGKIVMQVIPATHRMEVHMPLLSPSGAVIGTLCTVYFWKTPGEAADYYGRSLGIMEEARQLTPANRDDLFRP